MLVAVTRKPRHLSYSIQLFMSNSQVVPCRARWQRRERCEPQRPSLRSLLLIRTWSQLQQEALLYLSSSTVALLLTTEVMDGAFSALKELAPLRVIVEGKVVVTVRCWRGRGGRGQVWQRKPLLWQASVGPRTQLTVTMSFPKFFTSKQLTSTCEDLTLFFCYEIMQIIPISSGQLWAIFCSNNNWLYSVRQMSLLWTFPSNMPKEASI